MEKTFTNLVDLRTEIDLLKIKKFQQEEVLKDQLTDPSVIFKTITTHFKSKKSNKSALQGLMNNDMISNISRFIIPLFLNGTFFKKSGFLTKTIVTFLSQKAATKVNTNAVGGIVDKVKGWFAHKKEVRAVRERSKDYGIPPDSETY
jgi:hypothetical protein